MTELPLIPEFYNGKEIFITGGTGFVGKALIEKLLRSCPDIAKLYVLIRKKRGQSPSERVNQIKSNPGFRALLEKNPNVFDKVVAIEGDVLEPALGIHPNDIQLFKDVSIIIHASACVRFDDPLRNAIFTNVRATRDLMEIAVGLTKLLAFVHVSTTYCNADYKVIEEKIYTPHADWRKSIEIAEKLDSDILDIVTKKYTDFFPNTYVFTKGLAEEVCEAYKDRVPIVVYRPAIVSGSEKEPVPGWSDNLNNISGLGVAGGLGLMQHIYATDDTKFHLIPADICVKGIIIAAYKKAVEDEVKSQISVYNCTNGATDTKELIWLTTSSADNNNVFFKDAVWRRRALFVRSACMDFLLTIFMYVIPALLVDFVTKHVFKAEPRLLKIHRRIKAAKMALHFYIHNIWTIKNTNYMALDFFIRKEDRNDFSITSKATLDRMQYTEDQMFYLKEHILLDGDENHKKSKQRYYVYLIADNIIIYGLVLLVSKFVYHIFISPYVALV